MFCSRPKAALFSLVSALRTSFLHSLAVADQPGMATDTSEVVLQNMTVYEHADASAARAAESVGGGECDQGDDRGRRLAHSGVAPSCSTAAAAQCSGDAALASHALCLLASASVGVRDDVDQRQGGVVTRAAPPHTDSPCDQPSAEGLPRQAGASTTAGTQRNSMIDVLMTPSGRWFQCRQCEYASHLVNNVNRHVR